MPSSKDEVELCSLLVNESYGELPSRILTILLRRGRSITRELEDHTHLNRKQLRYGLAILIQQNLAYYFRESGTSVTYYEARLESAYDLIRVGKISEIIEGRYGASGGALMLNLILAGHTKVSDLMVACRASQTSHVSGLATNSDANGHDIPPGNSSADLTPVLYKLLEAGLIHPVNRNMFPSPSDLAAQAEKNILSSDFKGGTRGTKQQQALKAMVRKHLQGLRSEGQDWRPTTDQQKPEKDMVSGTSGNSKKRKHRDINDDIRSINGHGEDNIKLDPDLIVRVNYEKCTVALRSQRLVQLVKDRLGETTSHLYAEILRLLEEKIARCQIDPDIDDVDAITDRIHISTDELEAAMSPSVNVAVGIGDAEDNEVDVSKLERTQEFQKSKIHAVDGSSDEADPDEDMADVDGDRMEIYEDSEDRRARKFVKRLRTERAVTFLDGLLEEDTEPEHENHIDQLKKHLLLLAEDDYCFLRKCGYSGSGEWTVDFEPLVERLRDSELDKFILDNFGQLGLRLARLLRRFGKLEDKQLSTVALKKPKDVRTKLAEMQKAGVLDIQEVPKDASHSTTRTIFLWHFDKQRVSSILLNRTYKAIVRCYQRLEVEKRLSVEILELAERTDVKTLGEEGVMDRGQTEALQTIRHKEEKLLAQIGRLDEVVGIFRDY